MTLLLHPPPGRPCRVSAIRSAAKLLARRLARRGLPIVPPGNRLGTRAAVGCMTVALALLAFAPPAAAFVYWTNFSATYSIGRANLDGTGIDQSFITGASGKSTYGVAVDGAHIYWTNSGNSGSIGRANL